MSDQQKSETEPAEQRMSQEVIQTETGHEEDDDAEDQRRQNDRNQQGGETNQIISSSDVGNSTATGEILTVNWAFYHRIIHLEKFYGTKFWA